MIKVNVEADYKPWFKKIKYPKKYFISKLKKINTDSLIFKKKKLVFSILLTNSSNIKKLNKKFRNRNKPTDVLSFPNFSPAKLRLVKDNNIYIGDIALCYEVINGQSTNNNFLSEFDKTWIHGFLHLIGYDHIKKKDYDKMKKKEKKIFESII